MPTISPTPAMDALNPMQRAFVRAYLVGRIAKAAAIEAGYAAASAHNTGTRLLRRDDIIAAIREMEAAANERAEKSLDDVIREFTRIAFGGMSRFLRINSDGDPIIDLSQCSDEDLDLLAEVSVDDVVEGRDEDRRTVRKVRIKRVDKVRALETLGKHLGMGNKAQEEVTDRFTQALLEIARRGSAQRIGGKP